MGLIVDTGVFVHIERHKQDASLEQMLGSEALSISAVTVSELLVGLYRADTEARRTRRLQIFERILASTSQFAFTTDTARVHARLHADLQSRGQLIGAHDLLIAATAIEHGLAVLTTNRREFDRIPGLAVVAYPPSPAAGA